MTRANVRPTLADIAAILGRELTSMRVALIVAALEQDADGVERVARAVVADGHAGAELARRLVAGEHLQNGGAS